MHDLKNFCKQTNMVVECKPLIFNFKFKWFYSPYYKVLHKSGSDFQLPEIKHEINLKLNINKKIVQNITLRLDNNKIYSKNTCY